MTGFGLFLPQIRMSFDRIVERALAAEAAGYDAVWFIDHLWVAAGRDLDLLEGWTVASAVAARTTSINLGHMVMCDGFRHPAVLAKMASSLDVVSGGRFELGIGWGSTVDEFTAFGIPDGGASERSARLAETLAVLELLFAGDPVDYDGRFVQLREAIVRPLPVQRPLPIHIGGGGKRLTLPLVARYATGWNCPSYAVAQLAELRPLVGDRVTVSVQHPVGVVWDGADRAEVEAVMERRFAGWGGSLCGTPAELADALGAEVRLGVDRFVLQFWDFGTPETIARFAAEVMPAVREQL